MSQTLRWSFIRSSLWHAAHLAFFSGVDGQNYLSSSTINKSRVSEHRYRRKDITVPHKAQQEPRESGIYFHAWHHALSFPLLCLSDSFQPLSYGQLLCRCHYAIFPLRFHILRFSQPVSRVSAFSNCQNYPRPKIEAISRNELNPKLKVHMLTVRNTKLLFSSLLP